MLDSICTVYEMNILYLCVVKFYVVCGFNSLLTQLLCCDQTSLK